MKTDISAWEVREIFNGIQAADPKASGGEPSPRQEESPDSDEVEGDLNYFIRELFHLFPPVNQNAIGRSGVGHEPFQSPTDVVFRRTG